MYWSCYVLTLTQGTAYAHVAQLINNVTATGSTNMFAGIDRGRLEIESLPAAQRHDITNVENRVIIITDDQPNTGSTETESPYLLKTFQIFWFDLCYCFTGFVSLVSNMAKNNIFTTFIGVGVGASLFLQSSNLSSNLLPLSLDFESKLVETIMKVKGSNYFTSKTGKELKNKLEEQFDFAMSPMVFDLEVKIKTPGFRIERVYGCPDAELATGVLMKVNTLFPSPKSSDGVKGGAIIAQLKRVDEKAKHNTVRVSVSYKVRLSLYLPIAISKFGFTLFF